MALTVPLSAQSGGTAPLVARVSMPALAARGAPQQVHMPLADPRWALRSTVAAAPAPAMLAPTQLPGASGPYATPSPTPMLAATSVAGAPVLRPARQGVPIGLDEQQQYFYRMMKCIEARGFFAGLRPDQGGVLYVNVPFCGCFTEAPALAKFMLEDVLPRTPGARQVRVHCQDVSMVGIEFYKGAIQDPRVQLETQVADGSVTSQPPAMLTVGLHPQPLPVREDRLWDRIIENVIRSSPKCVFTCWMQAEAEQLVRMLEQLGCAVNVMRNPAPLPPEGYSMRFQWIVLAERR